MTRLDQLAALVTHREGCDVCGPSALCAKAAGILEMVLCRAGQPVVDHPALGPERVKA